MAEEADEETAHQQLMRGTKDFKGVRISEITPNERGTFRNQAAFNDEVPIPAFGEAMRLDTDLRSSKRAQ